MSANSIRSNLDRSSIISEIRLCRAADITHKYVHVIVEGPDDVKFFKCNVCNHVFLYESFKGKQGVLEIIAHFNANNVIGICDRDYDINEPSPHIFYYDRSTLETMLVGSKETFKKVCSTLCPEVDNIFELHCHLFQQLKLLNSIRKINAQQDLGLNINGINIYDCYNAITKELDNTKILQKLVNINRDLSLNHELSRKFFEDFQKEFDTPKNIEQVILETRGHDCIAMFHCLIKPDSGKDNYNETSILTTFICAFNFPGSMLYASLKTYSHSNGLSIVE